MSTIKTANIANLSGTSTSVENVLNGTAKAWVNFNGTGTVAIRAGYNVSSITDNGTGDYTVNFTTAMLDTNYSVLGTASSYGVIEQYASPIRTTTAIKVQSGLLGSTPYDCNYVNVSIFR